MLTLENSTVIPSKIYIHISITFYEKRIYRNIKINLVKKIITIKFVHNKIIST